MTQQATFYETIIDEHVQHHDDYPTFSSPFDACLREAASAKAGERVRVRGN